MLKLLELKKRELRQLSKHANDYNIDFLCTAFDINSLFFMMSCIKFIVPSGEINNFELLDHVKKKRKPIFLSTGLSTQKDVDNALNFLDLESYKKLE